MRAWYTEDRHTLTTDSGKCLSADQVNALEILDKSCDLLSDIIAREGNKLGNNRIVLAGFDQGSIVALFCALAKIQPTEISGVACFGMPNLSPNVSNFLMEQCTNTATKVFLFNGSHDTTTPPSNGFKWKEMLDQKANMKSTSFESVPNGTHEITDNEIAHLTAVISLLVKF